MKSVASLIGEALAATLVIIACLSLPSVLGLPVWTLPVLVIPAMFYLDWRLGERHWTRWKLLVWISGMTSLLYFFNRFVSGEHWLWIFAFLILFPPSSWLSKREDESANPR